MTVSDDDLVERIERMTSAMHHAPSVRELADNLGLFHTTVHAHLERLKRAGRVTWEPGRPRTLRVIRQADDDRPLREVHLSDLAWLWLGVTAEEQGRSRSDLLEGLVFASMDEVDDDS